MNSLTRPLRFVLLLASLWLSFFGATHVLAAQNTSAAIAQGFAIDGTTSDFVAGALVSTKTDNSNAVQLATAHSANRLVGVVGNEPLVALSDGAAKTQVVISGMAQVLVSDINGAIHAGDKITASPIAGVGMLATASDQVVGTAQGDLNTASAVAQTITDSEGQSRTVHLGRVSLQIGVSFYQAPTSGFVPPIIQGFADGIAGRPVSLVRILVCTILLLMAVVSTAALLYTAVRSGLISIGRNPLAAGAIRRGIAQIGFAVVLILGLVLLASYIILTA